MQKRHLHVAGRRIRAHAAENRLDDEAVLGDGKGVIAARLAVPAGNAGKTMGDIGNFHVERRRIEQIEPPPGEHALPGARTFCGSHA